MVGAVLLLLAAWVAAVVVIPWVVALTAAVTIADISTCPLPYSGGGGGGGGGSPP